MKTGAVKCSFHSGALPWLLLYLYHILFSACHSDINPHTLQLLDEVEFQLITKSGKTSASDVRLLPAGSISHEEIISSDNYDGIVLRPMKSLDKKVPLHKYLVKCGSLKLGCCRAIMRHLSMRHLSTKHLSTKIRHLSNETPC